MELLPRVVEMMHRELDERQDYLHSKSLTSIYFGGGTPSLLNPEDIEELIAHARRLFDCSAVDEITIEANPDDLTDEYVERLGMTSVNRVSLGVQSFDDRVLRFMNRRHSAEDAERAVERLRGVGIVNLSIDIIFGVAGFGEEHLMESLRRAIALDVGHISAYHLTIEERTRLGLLMRKGEYVPISEELSEEEFLAVHNALVGAGYDHYEVSNFAKEGCRAKHNSAYWSGVEYLGIGAGAHSFSRDNRTWCVSTAKEYSEGCFHFEDEVLSEQDHINEYVMTQLRTSNGVDLEFVAERYGEGEAQRLLRSAKPWLESGAVRPAANRLVIPSDKFLLSDADRKSVV